MCSHTPCVYIYILQVTDLWVEHTTQAHPSPMHMFLLTYLLQKQTNTQITHGGTLRKRENTIEYIAMMCLCFVENRRI